MLNLLLTFLGGPVIKGLIDGYRAKLTAQQNSERIAADLAAKEIEADIQARAAAKEVVIAEQGRWYTAIIRPLAAAPFVIYVWKLVVFDKVLGLGATDDLSPELWQLMTLVFGAYFLGRSAEKVARSIRR